MPQKKIIESTRAAKEKAIEQLRNEHRNIRAGGASVAMLDSVHVESYGSMVPLNQVGAVSVADARTLVVTPFDKSDKSALKNIEKGILSAHLNMNPQNDGISIRINIPSLTEDKRKELVKKAKEMAEKAKVKIRIARQEAHDRLKKGKKDGDFSDDDVKKLEKTIQQLTDEMIKLTDDILKNKEKELMTI